MVTLVQHQQTVIENPENDRQKLEDHVTGGGEDIAVPLQNRVEVERYVKSAESAESADSKATEVGSELGCSTRTSSDVEDDDVEEEGDTDLESGEWITEVRHPNGYPTEVQQIGATGVSVKRPLPPSLPRQTVDAHQEVAVANGSLILPNAENSNFGDICVKYSSNVHLGNKTFYKGPVTIKQFVYTNPSTVRSSDDGNFEAGRVSDANASDLSSGKGEESGANRPILPPQNLDYDKVSRWLWTWRCAAILCILALILVTAVVVSSVLLTRSSETPPTPIFPAIPDSSLEGVIVSNVRFVERNEWGAQPPTEELTKLKLPVPYVIISHTATEFCDTQSTCTLHVRFAQTFHIESRKWSDIAYNFLVGGDGLAYVGRSWDYMGAHAFGYNNKSIGISFIGTFNKVVPPKTQIHAARRIIELGVEAGKIAKDYKLLGHRQVSKTLSPGDALYNEIKTWPHWVPAP